MTREEAIKIVWSATVWTDEEREALAMLIPELAESEDERIRKDIIALIELFTDGSAVSPGSRTTKEEALEWLEKQKEEEGYEAIPVESTLEYKLGFKVGKESEKQKEQKPNVLQIAFDKSKKDYTLEEKSKASDYAESILPTSIMYGESEEEYKLHTIIETAFIAGQKEQKPAWSEEDEKILNELLDYCNTENATWYNWLKSLRPQPKQNDMITPNKEFFQWIYDRLVNVHKEDPNVDYMISFKRRIEESSWKPSEEQIKAIKHAYNSFPNECLTKSNLRLLYYDLEKLM